MGDSMGTATEVARGIVGYSVLKKLFRPPVRKLPPGVHENLGRRLAAVKSALKNLPRQAKRMARWKLRRATMQSPKFRSPLRPGPPPGHRRMARDEIDFVLRACHWMAWEALREDTS